MERETFEYKCDTTVCKGYLVYNEIAKESHPGILLIHPWRGLDDFVKEKAEAYARLGYIVLAVDLYGAGKVAKSDEEAGNLMMPLFLNRQLLRERIVAGYEAFINHHLVSKKQVGAVGFCFGGLAAIELLRSGNKVACVSVHGLLGETLGENKAEKFPNAESLKGSFLALSGHNDPLVSQEDISNLEKELTETKVDWQIHIYGGVMHAFTNPQAKDPSKGMAFNQIASDRAWKSIRNFFEEKFKS